MDVLNTIANNRLWNKHSVKLVWFLALLVLALILGSIGWTAWTQKNIKQTNYQAQKITPIRAASRPTYRVSDIVAANLFGDPTPPPVVVKVAPKTTLDLTLMGVLWSTDNTIGRAIIMSGKKASVLYSIGEEIKGSGAKVEEIRDAEIILNRNGALESLPLNKLVDSGNRIIVTYNEDPVESAVEEYPIPDSADPQMNTNDIIDLETESGETRRVRRPNFSGLDRALEKMGEL